MNKKLLSLIVLLIFLPGCVITSPTYKPPANVPPNAPTPTFTPQEGKIPNFEHIIMIMFENKSFDQVVGSSQLPTFNDLAKKNVLLTQYYALAHPSLPNYIALAGGDTFNITSDCKTCYINAKSLPDLIEASGRTWKTYQESMPSPCFTGNADNYLQRHDPFIYFDPVRNDKARCNNSIVPISQLDTDLSAGKLPNFAFIMPNRCNSAHDCGLDVSDQWLKQMVDKLTSSPALGQNYAIFITFDESDISDKSSCCGVPEPAGGHIATILISPRAQAGTQDNTLYNHYSLLKTILYSWRLPGLGYTQMPEVKPIAAPWK
jgi:phospholipase C